MQQCEYRDDCLPERFPGTKMEVCPVEETGQVAICRHRLPQACGHPMLYQRMDLDLGDGIDAIYCALCEEDAEATSLHMRMAAANELMRGLAEPWPQEEAEHADNRRDL